MNTRERMKKKALFMAIYPRAMAGFLRTIFKGARKKLPPLKLQITMPAFPKWIELESKWRNGELTLEEKQENAAAEAPKAVKAGLNPLIPQEGMTIYFQPNEGEEKIIYSGGGTDGH